MKKFLLVSSLLFIGNAYALENFKFAPVAETVFPVFAGGGAKLRFYENFETSLSYGVTPKAYYKVIGNAAAHFGENDSYKEVVEAAFQDNSMWRVGLQYDFQGKFGWNFGATASRLKSSGSAGIDRVLGATTGNDYTALKNLLIALHRSTDVTMDSELTLGEIAVGYTWDFGHNIGGKLSFGAAKVMSADVKLQTGLPNYEASASGSSTLRQTESDLEDIIKENGITPTVSFGISYEF
jgi:hypothetical protein